MNRNATRFRSAAGARAADIATLRRAGLDYVAEAPARPQPAARPITPPNPLPPFLADRWPLTRDK